MSCAKPWVYDPERKGHLAGPVGRATRDGFWRDERLEGRVVDCQLVCGSWLAH